jgi:hypothetical protein
MAHADERLVLLADTGSGVVGQKSCKTLIDEWQERMNGREGFWEESDE